MMQPLKRLIAALMALVLICTAVPFPAYAEKKTDMGSGINYGGLVEDSSSYATGSLQDKEIDVDEQTTLTGTSNASSCGYGHEWTSSDPSVAAVSGSGTTVTVTGVSAGTTKITHKYCSRSAIPHAILGSHSVASEECTVTVSAPSLRSLSISSENDVYEVNAGGTLQLAAEITPRGAETTLVWSSGNTDVLTVDQNGLVTGVAAGEATVTLTDETTRKTATLTITVTEPVALKSVTIEGDQEMTAFTEINLTAVLDPVDADITSMSWQSLNAEVLTVDETGKVYGVQPGEGTIQLTVNCADGTTKTAEHKITVKETTESTHEADFYYLKTPTSNPASNSVDQWGKTLGAGKINITGATWVNNKNCFNPAGRIISWPASTNGNVVPRGSSHWNVIYEAFKETVSGITSPDDVEAIILHPYKISNNERYHVDCTVEIKAKTISTATYYLWDAGDTGYIWKAAQNYRNGEETSPFGPVQNLPDTKTVNGVTYTFDGWYTNANRTGTKVVFPYTMAKENVNFYAKYIAGYQVNYDLAGGSWGIQSTYNKNEGTTVQIVSTIPTRTGYNFIGWTSEDLTTPEIQAGSFVMPGHNVTLTAQWQRNVFDVTYDYGTPPAGASELPATTSHNYGDPVTVAPAATAPGYTFSGWTTNDVIVNDGKFTMPDKDVAFTGSWTIRNDLSYTVRYYWNGTTEPVADSKTVTGRTFGQTYSESPTNVEGCTPVSTAEKSVTIGTGENEIIFYYYKNVTLQAKSGTYTYDGTEKTVSGYTGAPDGVTFEGVTASRTETNAGEYPVEFSKGAVGTVDASKLYIITAANPGKLKITDSTVEIVVTTTGGTFTYDGEAHGATVSVSTLPKGYTLDTATSNDTATNVSDGTVTANCDTLVIKNAQGVNVTSKLNIKYVDGSIKITPRPVTVTAKSKAFTYDGQAHSESGYDVVGLVGKDAISAVVTGSITYVKQSPVTNKVESHEFTKGDSGNYTVSYKDGQLTMSYGTKIAITITAASDSKTYDGSALTNSGVTVTSGSLIDGDRLVATATGSATNVADTTTGNNPIADGYKVMNGNVDVTAKYDITTAAGTLTINPKAVTVTAKSEAFTYDGQAHSNDGYDVVGLVGDDEISAVVTGSITYVDESPVTNELVSYEFTTGTPGNYSVTTANGELTMTYGDAVAITITAASDSKTYDGSALTNNGITVTSGSLIDGDRLVATANGSATNVADTATGNNPVAAGYKVMNGDVDVTAKYAITTAAGTLTINPKAVTVTADDKSKIYGTTDPELTATVSGLVEGEQESLIVYTLARDEGENVGTYDITPSGDEDQGNYTVSYVKDTLTIERAQAKVVAQPAFKEHGAEDPTFTAKVYRVVGETEIEGLYGTDTVTYTVSRTGAGEAAAELVGTYDDVIVPTGETTQGNYTVEYVPADFEILLREGETVPVTKTIGDQKLNLGETATFTITVTNIFNTEKTMTVTELPGVSIKSCDVTGASTVGNVVTATLQPGQVATITAQCVVDEAMIRNGYTNNAYTNKVTVMLGDLEGEAEAVLPTVPVNAALEVTKTSEDKLYSLADTITYTITVKNTGNVTLTDLQIVDELTGGVTEVTTVDGEQTSNSIAPNETRTYTATYTVTKDDVKANANGNVVKTDSGEYTLTNTVVATAKYTPTPAEAAAATDDKQADTASETIQAQASVTNRVVHQDLEIVKTVLNPQDVYDFGEVIEYQITVTNNGTYTEPAGLTITDQMNNATGNVTYYGDGWKNGVYTLPQLNPGDSVTVYCSYTVQESDFNRVLSNTAVVRRNGTPEDISTSEGSQVIHLYSLAILYLDADTGNALADTYLVRLKAGTPFYVKSPVIDGYTTDILAIKSGVNGMPAQDLVFKVLYTAVEEPEEEPEEPEVNVVTPTEDGGYDLTPIGELDTPLADMDLGDHTCCIMHFLLMLASLITLAFYTDSRKKHQARIHQLRQSLRAEGKDDPSEKM